MAAISDNLLHFLGRSDRDAPRKQFEVFKAIIERGLRCGLIAIKFSEGAAVTNQAVCFTDIPLKECNDHASVYGKFGIGLTKAFVKSAGGNPARYFVNYLPGQNGVGQPFESRGQAYLRLCAIFKPLVELKELFDGDPNFELHDPAGNVIFDRDRIGQLINNLIGLYSFDKETGDLGPARDETRDTDLYYKEREWRLVPSPIDLHSGIAELTDKYYFYKFERRAVNMIVVPNEDIRVAVLEYFHDLKNHENSRLRGFGENPVPVIAYDDLQKW